jgi:hypothetical protein
MRAFALCFMSGPSNDAVFRYRWEKHEHAHMNTRPTAQRPPPTILLAHASSWKKAETEDRFGASLFLFAEMVRLQRFDPVDWNKEDDRVAHWLICNLGSVSIC